MWKSVVVPKHFILGYLNHQKREILDWRLQTKNLKYMLSQCLVLQETHSKGAALKAGIRNLKSEIQNPESGSSGSLKIQQLGWTKIVSRKP